MNDRFQQYFLMSEEDIGDYVRSRLDFFDPGESLTCTEIGDGNVNYVFRVKGENRSLIVKQAGKATRIDKNWFLSTDRGRIEADVLTIQEELAPGLVPKVYLYDPVMCAILMEDMAGYTMMRTALMEHRRFPHFAEQISTFLVNSLLLTSSVVMEHKAKKDRVRSFINPELCEISEQLVYTEPYNNEKNRNLVFAPNEAFVREHLYENKPLHLAVAKLKFDFMNNAQCLIHGDLHTGSIFINDTHTFVFDPEFAFYGPAGYDVGNIIANLLFAWCNADATMEEGEERETQKQWLERAVTDIIDMFITKYHIAFKENVNDSMAKTDGFEDWYLNELLESTAGVTGLELNRRIVGMAQVKDITTIADASKRAAAERILITAANRYILEASRFKTGADFLNNFLDAVRQEGGESRT